VNRPPARQVVLVLPADTQHLRLARLMAAGVAAPAGLGIDDVDDLRIAVDELCTTLLEASGDGPLTLMFEYDEGQVTVSGRVTAQRTIDAGDRRQLLSKEILAVVADEHELRSDGDDLTFRLVKRVEARTGALD
jgi:anti-sigma regulatory factor (Ser/Thr protein kinase)